ncbi:MAG: MFS transporter [Acidimicrobiales bacterium]
MDELEESSPGSEVVAVGLRGIAYANITAILWLEGAVAALYGPLLLTIAKKFQVSLPQAGGVLSVHFVGALVGVAIGWIAMRRVRGGLVVSAALVCLALGALAVALTAGWGLFLGSIFVIGLGFGGLSCAVNSLLARTALAGRPRRLSIANAGYCVGAIMGPLLVILVRPRHYTLLFGAAAAVAALLSTMNRGIIAPPQSAVDRRHELSSPRSNRRSIVITFILAYLLYEAAESSSSGWIAAQLHREGHSATLGSLITGCFWLGLAFGRIAGGPLHRRFAERALVLVGLSAALVCAAVAYSATVAPYAYPVLGLALASVYPMGIVWFTRLCPHDRNGLALIVFCMMAGGVLGPGAESLLVSLVGVHVVPVVIAVLITLDLGVFASARRFTAPALDVIQ